MKNKKQKKPFVARQIGEFHVTEAIVERRKRAKRPEGARALPLFDEARTKLPATSSDQGEVERAKPADSLAAEGGSLFQSNAHCCDESLFCPPSSDSFPTSSSVVYSSSQLGTTIGKLLRIRGCSCRKWFCMDCGPRRGWWLREKLIHRLQGFTKVLGITLTVDGSLFQSPEHAWQYVMDERLLSRFRRELERRGHLHSSHYFWTVEFQKKTQQPHWHLLFDATYVPYGEVVEIWSRYRPKWASPLLEPITANNYEGKAPALGSVRISMPNRAEKAAFYATKYLLKHPAEGYPDWVLDRVGRLPRYGHSRRFFPPESTHDSSCFCEECHGDQPVQPPKRKTSSTASKERKPRRRELKTIRLRIAECKTECSIVEVPKIELSDGSVIEGKGTYLGKLELPFSEVEKYIEAAPGTMGAIDVTEYELGDLLEAARERANSGDHRP